MPVCFPTGPLPEAIDFPLYEQEENEEFEVLFTADPQPYHLQHLTLPSLVERGDLPQTKLHANVYYATKRRP